MQPTDYFASAALLAFAFLTLAACSSDTANTPPVASNAEASTGQAQQVSGSLRASDADGDALTYAFESVVSDPAKGSIALDDPATGGFTYTPTARETGTNTFTFSASDGLSSSNSATVTIDVTPSATGIWTGEAVPAGGGEPDSVLAMVSADGLATILVNESTLLIGRLSATGDAATGTLDAYAAPGKTFSDGSSAGLVALDGLVTTASTFSGTLSGVGESSTFNLAYDTETFERPPALDDLSASWSAELASGKSLNLTFDREGNISGADSEGCQYGGAAALVSPVTNVYGMAVEITDCAERDGSYAGLASLTDPNGHPLYRCLACEQSMLFGIASEGFALSGLLED